MSGLKFPKGEKKKKECPIQQVFLEVEKTGATCAADMDILKNIIYLVARIGHYQKNMD